MKSGHPLVLVFFLTPAHRTVHRLPSPKRRILLQERPDASVFILRMCTNTAPMRHPSLAKINTAHPEWNLEGSSPEAALSRIINIEFVLYNSERVHLHCLS